MLKRICEFCGKEFESTGRNASRRKYCPEGHTLKCSICGKEFLSSLLVTGYQLLVQKNVVILLVNSI